MLRSAAYHSIATISNISKSENTTTWHSLRPLSADVVDDHAAVLDPAKYGDCLVVAPTLQAQAVDRHNFVACGRKAVITLWVLQRTLLGMS